MASHVVDTEQLERDLAELLEVEKFTPPDEFRQQALVKDMTLHTEAERNLYWSRLIRIYPPYRGYRKAADRVIPLVVCEP